MDDWPTYKRASDLSGTIFPVSEAVILATAREHGIGRKMGRTIIFSREDIQHLYEVLPCPSGSCAAPNHPTGSSAAPSGASALKKALARIKKAFAGACSRAGIQDFSAHGCRHTWATWHYAANRDVSALMRLGGWKTVSMVMRYVHANVDEHRHTIERLPGGVLGDSAVSKMESA